MSANPARFLPRLATLLPLAALTCFLAAPAKMTAQTSAIPSPTLAGDYSGTFGPLALKLHLASAANAAFTGTLDSPSQGANGIPIANIVLQGNSLSFEVPAVHGTWKGTFNPSTLRLTGTWNQGKPQPLEFTRDSLKPSLVDGIWLGTLKPPSGDSLRIQMTLHSDITGSEFCTVDSLDQGAVGLACAGVRLRGKDLRFDMPSVEASFSGKLSADGNTISGTFIQGGPLPLTFARQAAAAAAHPPLKFDPALPPVAAADLQSVLARDLAGALKDGVLAPETHAGVAVGVIQHGNPYVFTFGTAKPDSIFEIGSISKTFTGLILAQMIEQNKVKLDEPVRDLLPPGTVAKPDGPEITLVDLTTQHSGLPRMPDNFAPADPTNPYRDYDSSRLYAYLAKHGVARDPAAPFLYSNLGVGLLGQALANRAQTTYGDLLHNQIALPLGLSDTTIALSPEQLARFIPCFDAAHRPAHAWDLVAFAGAGGIRSTAADMLRYLQAQLHPDQLPAGPPASAAATLPAAIALSHELRADAGGARIAFNWLYDQKTSQAPGVYWHNGATGGFTSYAFFAPSADYAAIVLINTGIGPTGSLADLLGKHIRARLAGEPAVQIYK